VPYLFQLLVIMLNVPFNLDLMDWVFVAIGVWEGWSIPRSLNRQAETAPSSEPDRPATEAASQSGEPAAAAASAALPGSPPSTMG
jgi:hypothetical protein